MGKLSPTSTLSLVMIVRDSAATLARCLQSAAPFVDEMVVLDTGSTDNTRELAAQIGARVYELPWPDDFAAARNAALERATGQWRLILDSDEYLTGEPQAELVRVISGPPVIGRVKIISPYMDNGELRQSRVLTSRILPEDARYAGRIHEQVVSSFPRVNTAIEVYHEGYMETGHKLERNVKLLEATLREAPGSAYLLYQLGNEYFVRQRHREAERYFAQAYPAAAPSERFRPNLVVNYLYSLANTGNWRQGQAVIAAEGPRLADYPDFHFAVGVFTMQSPPSGSLNEQLQRIQTAFETCLALGESGQHDSVVGTGSYLAAYNLGAFHTALGNTDRARRYYEQAAAWGYLPARTRLGE